MVEDIKNLIEKIKEEGIQAAEERAREIEQKAKSQAFAIVEKANQVAEQMIAQAKDKIAKMEASSRASLEQASRDVLLNLRQEIKAMLEEIIVLNVRDALTPERLAEIISNIIKDNSSEQKADIVISLRKEDAKEIEASFLTQLKVATKNKIVLKVSDDISGGFIISYDSGKSHFDFTDKALANYISNYLDPKLAEILKKTVDKNLRNA